MPSINHDNIGPLLPSDLLGALSLFDGKYGDEE